MSHNNNHQLRKNLIIAFLMVAMAGLAGSSCKELNSADAVDDIGNASVLPAGNCDQGTVNVTRTWTMPSELFEISGITWLDKDRTAAIQDEHGIIFIYNLVEEKVEKKIDFGLPGDYEGISRVSNTYFVIRSDGHLLEISEAGKIVNRYDLPLSAKDNIESFFYDAINHRLLIGQKDGDKAEGRKDIYSFDLKSRNFNSTPVYSIDLSHPTLICANDTEDIKGKKKAKKNKAGQFRPSELAIEPNTRDIYIADGPNQRILVLSPDGTPKHFLAMDKQVLPKAEGLMFSPDGELYISTEGVKNAGNISKVSVTMNN